MTEFFKNPIVTVKLSRTEQAKLRIDTDVRFEVLMLNVNRNTMRGRILDEDGNVLYGNVDLSMSMIVDDTITIERKE